MLHALRLAVGDDACGGVGHLDSIAKKRRTAKGLCSRSVPGLTIASAMSRQPKNSLQKVLAHCRGSGLRRVTNRRTVRAPVSCRIDLLRFLYRIGTIREIAQIAPVRWLSRGWASRLSVHFVISIRLLICINVVPHLKLSPFGVPSETHLDMLPVDFNYDFLTCVSEVRSDSAHGHRFRPYGSTPEHALSWIVLWMGLRRHNSYRFQHKPVRLKRLVPMVRWTIQPARRRHSRH